jgi:hypothetical protein
VRGSARFDAACRAYSTGMIAFYRADPLRPLLLADLGRLGVIAALMVGPPPVTVSGLARMSGGLSGRARIAGHVRVLARTGMTAPGPAADRRFRALTPTPALEATMGAWMRAMAGPAVALAGRSGDGLDDPAVARDYLGQVMGAHALGFDAFADAPAVGRLMTLAGGHLLALHLHAAPDEVDAAVPFSRTEFARAFGLSRPHVVDLLREAEARGWLRREPGGLAVSAAFREEVRRWLATHLALAPIALDGRLVPLLARASPRPI